MQTESASQPRIQTEAQTLFLKQIFHLSSTYLRLSAGLDLNSASTSFMNLQPNLNTTARSCWWLLSLIISARPLCVYVCTYSWWGEGMTLQSKINPPNAALPNWVWHTKIIVFSQSSVILFMQNALSFLLFWLSLFINESLLHLRMEVPLSFLKVFL